MFIYIGHSCASFTTLKLYRCCILLAQLHAEAIPKIIQLAFPSVAFIVITIINLLAVS